MSDADFRREVRTILEAIGEDPDRQGLRRTPERVELALRWLTRGYGMSVQDVVGDGIFD
jgi:GTP cyclohydrolase I